MCGEMFPAMRKTITPSRIRLGVIVISLCCPRSVIRSYGGTLACDRPGHACCGPWTVRRDGRSIWRSDDSSVRGPHGTFVWFPPIGIRVRTGVLLSRSLICSLLVVGPVGETTPARIRLLVIFPLTNLRAAAAVRSSRKEASQASRACGDPTNEFDRERTVPRRACGASRRRPGGDRRCTGPCIAPRR